MNNCPSCGAEIPKRCPICGEEGRHERTGGKLGELPGVTQEDWRTIYELTTRQEQETLALIHSIMVRIEKEKPK